jgi:signal transduction histidine kinase
MAAHGASELGETLRRTKGFPTLRRAELDYRLRRTALVVLALTAFGLALAGATVAFEGHADAGVVVDSSGTVASVSTTGFAWRDGVRPGQRVLATSRADSVDGWSIETEGPAGPILSREQPLVDALRSSLPFGLLGLGCGCLGLIFLRGNREWVLPATCLALVGASIPLQLANDTLSAPALLLAAVAPAWWATWRLRDHPLVAALVALGCGTILVLWASAHFSGANDAAIDHARRAVALGGAGLLMVDRAVQSRPARLGHVSPLQLMWILGAGAAIAVGLALVSFGSFPAPIVAFVVVLGLLMARPLGSMIGRRVEMALMADLRAHVAADVAEEERGRLARELHDTPLQELSAVIRRLELVPDAQAETASLHAVADQLRSLAIDLRPPMLDDLGLGAALDFLAEQSSSDGVHVVHEIADSTGLEPGSRPPPAVELAMYRIAREAVTNALHHATATAVRISASIDKAAIDLLISDNGSGLSRDMTQRASGRGRLGITSMRRRAQAIGAEFAIDGAAPGTRISVTWRA